MLAASGVLFLAWVIPHARTLVSVQNGGVRFPLCLFLAALILCRRPPGEEAARAERPWRFALAGVIGAGAAIAGVIVPVGLLEWAGLLLVVSACLGWALPAGRAANVPAALFVLFWAHPIPSRIFAPLQVTMQHASVEGSEWLLHVLNRRVWADGLVLHTGLSVYEVPAWCSGMRTATTVMLAALGLGLFKRLHGWGITALVAASLAQALVLNVMRIAAMVIFVPLLAGATGVSFLHDTAGAIVVLAVVLTYLELLFLDHLERRHARRRAELNLGWFEQLSHHPPAWRDIVRHRWTLLALALAAVLAAVAAYKSRPYHRAEMVKGVVEAFIDTHQYELADRAAREVSERVPDDADWRLTALRVLMLRGEYERVLSALSGLRAANPDQATQHAILRAYCLMAMGRLAEAAEAVRALPEALREGDPRVAMVMAEMARFGGDADRAAACAIQAAAWAPNRDRIRALYPYLRANRKWEAIARTDARTAYRSLTPALCATEAFMNLDDVPRVSALTLELMRASPNDPRILEPVYFLASRNPNGSWSDRFADHLLRCVDGLSDPDALYALFDKCYALGRPDLMWRLHRRIEALDPDYPGLLMNAVVNARRWFTVHRRAIGMEAARDSDTVDLRPAYRWAAATAVWAPVCGRVPYGADLSAASTVALRKAYLARALAEFARRAAAGRLTLDMRYAYVSALEMDGQVEAARRELDAIAAADPAQAWRTRSVLSEIYERQGDAQRVYETLREYPVVAEADLAPRLRLARAQTRLHLGVGAIETTRAALAAFPLSAQAADAYAEALSQFDSAEEALLALDRPRVRTQASTVLLEIAALHRSQRYIEAARVSRAAMLAPPPVPSSTVQRPYLPPAEHALRWHELMLPAADEFRANAQVLEANRPANTSPFIAGLTDLWLACYRAGGAEGTADPRRWAAAGRDPAERAQLLNQLAFLLCRQGRTADALEAALQAADALPTSPLLWRMAVSLSRPDRRAAAAARQACPADSELWLADLVLTTQAAAGLLPALSTATPCPALAALPPAAPPPADVAAWLDAELRAAVEENRYTPAAMARAADYLYRGGFRAAANMAARNAAERAHGLLPAYVVGLRCAIVEQDRARALQYTKDAIGAALSPAPILYEKLVGLKSAEDPIATDNEMVEALKVLRREDPENPLWAQMLGYVRFRRGGWEVIDALTQMDVALAAAPTNRMPYLVAAEAARQLDRLDRATEILDTAATRFPGDRVVLNNLVYTLALRADTIPRALDLLPSLLQEAREDVHVMDTASTVYTRSGLLDQADTILEQILRIAPEDSRSWFRARVRQAELLMLRGRPADAAAALSSLIGHSAGMPDEDVLTATRLLEDAHTQALRDAARTVEPPARPLPQGPP